MGLYEEAAEVLRESFTIKTIRFRLTSPDMCRRVMRVFSTACAGTPCRHLSTDFGRQRCERKNDEGAAGVQYRHHARRGREDRRSAAVAAAKEFAAGTDSMRAFRQIYAASRLVRNGVGNDNCDRAREEARKAPDDALKVPV